VASRCCNRKPATQALSLVAMLAWLPGLPGPLQVLAWALMWAALILTLVTGVDYIREAIRMRARARKQDLLAD